eukprot:2345319-Lingulodinium_polyedra.AAC.1
MKPVEPLKLCVWNAMSATTALGTHWKLSIHSRIDSWVKSSDRVFWGATQTKRVAPSRATRTW